MNQLFWMPIRAPFSMISDTSGPRLYIEGKVLFSMQLVSSNRLEGGHIGPSSLIFMDQRGFYRILVQLKRPKWSMEGFPRETSFDLLGRET